MLEISTDPCNTYALVLLQGNISQTRQVLTQFPVLRGDLYSRGTVGNPGCHGVFPFGYWEILADDSFNL